MTVATLTLIQSLLIVFGLFVVFFGRDYSVDHRRICRRSFVMFCVMLIYNQVTIANGFLPPVVNAAEVVESIDSPRPAVTTIKFDFPLPEHLTAYIRGRD